VVEMFEDREMRVHAEPGHDPGDRSEEVDQSSDVMKGLVARPLLAFDYLEAESTQYCNRRLKRIVTRRTSCVYYLPVLYDYSNNGLFRGGLMSRGRGRFTVLSMAGERTKNPLAMSSPDWSWSNANVEAAKKAARDLSICRNR